MAEGMDKREYRRAVKAAKRVIAFVSISEGRMIGVKISKRQALFLIKTLADDKPINAVWADPEETYLFVG